MLSEARVRNAKPKGKPYKLSDGYASYLLVKHNGGRLWRLKYRFGGVEKVLTLGIYPDVTLKRFREKRDEARRLLADGIDPGAARKAEQAASANTFKLVAEEWLDLQAKELAAETLDIYRGRLTSELYQPLGHKAIDDIEAPELLAVCRRIEARGRRESAHRVRALYGRIARFAIATGRAQRDISRDLQGALGPVRAQHFASIVEPKRVGELLRAIDGYTGQPAVHYALKLAPLVFVRPGELRAAEWREFDLDAAEWRIPAGRMKGSTDPHVVPLAAQSLALLRELQAITGDGKLLFASLRTPSRPISDNTINAALRRLGYSSEEMTGHGFRSMASTLLNEQGWNDDWIEAQLAHRDTNKVRASYNFARYLDGRRKMMQAWADYLDGLRKGASVTAIQHARHAAP